MVLIVIPGPDFAVVTKNTLVGGRRRGRWTALGVSSSNRVQGSAAAADLTALIVRVQPLHRAPGGRLAAIHLQHHQPQGAGLLPGKVRRALDATTGAVLLGFGARLATEHV